MSKSTKVVPAKVVPIVSGGLDSTTLLYKIHRDPRFEVAMCLSFDYGQRHKQELEFAERTCSDLGADWSLIDLSLSGITNLLADASTLIGANRGEIPEGHYAADNMKSTVVPGRNLMMLSIAASIAEALGADLVATAVHAGDHFVYPDCRPGFILAASQTIQYSTDLAVKGIYTPFLSSSKADIAFEAMGLGVPLHSTWSCYKGQSVHCGRCGTCVERLEAIVEAQLRFRLTTGDTYPDHTIYADNDYWKDQANV